MELSLRGPDGEFFLPFMYLRWGTAGAFDPELPKGTHQKQNSL